MLKITETTFIKSIVSLKDRPNPILPEFCFAGRSNVGKSSLINCITSRKNFAKVSKTPGKTRTINYFGINQTFYLVDVPGYGFARVSDSEKIKWKNMIEDYLLNNASLVKLYVLIDAFVGPQKNDIQLLEWIQFNNVPFKLIATKADKLTMKKKNETLGNIRKLTPIKEERQIIFFSSKNNTGKAALLEDMSMELNSMLITKKTNS